ncbi:hypothetical protein LFT44_00615 [Arthrobacter sp. FW306-05-C]|uniref:hypothetical protein n=1 Tax=Arthrobacter TaxID=1663 RepID=UPI001EF120D8|nr:MULTISPECIES: hypothetical protein [Arthrobacter]MDP9985894.1 hypothetical protein [Arthrobacter oryzae]UKA66982.1 hypothetical protein LFT44_00615 [Arthrobacter sp. FW306-05-C]UKA71295.1 hypothetical protein LFT49_00615 [Arthrobacter sp. FW306-06-A]
MMHRTFRRCLFGTAFAGGLLAFGGVAANAAAAAMPVGYSSTPSTLANTGVNSGLLIVGLLFLAFGGLLTLVLSRKRR